jgi:4-hydroxybenzoate polyprenyltransferase
LVDRPVWQQAAGAIVVNAPEKVRRAAASVTKVLVVVPTASITWPTIVRLLRCHQWVKNVLVWAPLIAAHALGLGTWWVALWSFVAFCLVSSSVYVLNDLLDMAVDRQHPSKRRRPLAAGDVPIPIAVALIPGLLVVGIGIGWSISLLFLGWLLVYLGLTTLYSFYLKRLVVIDVVVLGLLYTLRIFAGAAASAVMVSTWLFVFSLFLFMSLALFKRFTELLRSLNRGGGSIAGRGYQGSDTAPIGGFGMASGYLSVLVLALYISSSEVTVLYSQPLLLWFLIPLLLYWISRLWVLAYRDTVHDDPVVFAMSDQVSYIILGMSLLLVWLAT